VGLRVSIYMKNEPKRSIWQKEKFLQGSRQAWCGIFTTIGLIILVMSSYSVLKNPEIFLEFFLSLGVTFILGASASDVIKSYKMNPPTSGETQDQPESNIYEAEVTEIVSNSPKPFGKQAVGDEKDGPHDN